jgi:hypothetical protein
MGVIMAEVITAGITAVTMDIMAVIIMVTTITMEGMEDGEQDWG